MKRQILLLLALISFCVTSSFAEESVVDNMEVSIPPLYIEYPLILKKRQTLTGLLTEHGLSKKDAAKAMYRLQRKYNVKKLPPGQKLVLKYLDEYSNMALQSISFNGPDDKHISITPKGEDDFNISIKKRALTKKEVAVHGVISDSLYASAKQANLPAALVGAFANLFAWELDFTRDIRPGDTFKVVYEQVLDEEGNMLRSGNILAAELKTQTRKKVHDAFRTKTPYGIGYYNSKGYNKRKTLLRTPLEFTRISSNFNLKRKHPILGYTRAHKGTDFAAPRGTPIRAAGDGIITRASWYGGFGRFISIKHDGNKFVTRYAHLHRYARGIKKNRRVKQGQIIGYVGTSGRSTGPHLHYEVMRHGKHVNPMRVKLPTGKRVAKKERIAFQNNVKKYQQMWADAIKASAKGI